MHTPNHLTTIPDIINSFNNYSDQLQLLLKSNDLEKARKIICSHMKRVLELSHPRIVDKDRSEFVETLYKCNPTAFFPESANDFETLLFSFDEYFRNNTSGHVSYETLMRSLDEFGEKGKSDIYLFDDYVDLDEQKSSPEMNSDDIVNGLFNTKK